MENMSKGSNRNKRNWKELYNRNLVCHLAVFTLLSTCFKDFRVRLISWWAFHFVSSRLPLETALRWKCSGRKTLCFALPYWSENIQRQEILFWLNYSQKSKQRLVRFWRKKSDILKRQWQNNPENRPTCEWFTTHIVTVMLCPEYTTF